MLQQDWVETNRAPDTRSGYFITAAYIEQGNYWYRADGRHGSNVFPAFEKWALLPYSGPQRVAPPVSLAKLTSDYGNDPRAGTDARIVGVDDHAIHTEHLDCELQSINVMSMIRKGAGKSKSAISTLAIQENCFQKSRTAAPE